MGGGWVMTECTAHRCSALWNMFCVFCVFCGTCSTGASNPEEGAFLPSDAPSLIESVWSRRQLLHGELDKSFGERWDGMREKGLDSCHHLVFSVGVIDKVEIWPIDGHVFKQWLLSANSVLPVKIKSMHG